MTKKSEKEFLWLKVLHLIDDNEKINVNKLCKMLNSKFFIKERKNKR